MSEELKQFLSDYLAWIDAGAPPSKPFERGYGLCSNTFYFDGDWEAVDNELSALFKTDGLDRVYPFGKEAYEEASVNDTHHLYQPRIDWIKSKLTPA